MKSWWVIFWLRAAAQPFGQRVEQAAELEPSENRAQVWRNRIGGHLSSPVLGNGSAYCVDGAQIAADRNHARRRRRRRRAGDAELEHPRQALDVVHLGFERDGARLVDALVAVATGERDERVDAAHAGPRKRRVE